MTQSHEQNEKVEFLNLILKAGFFMLKMARMSESKLSRMKFQEQQQKTEKKSHLSFYLKVMFLAEL